MKVRVLSGVPILSSLEVTLSYYEFYKLSNFGLNLAGVTDIRREFKSEYPKDLTYLRDHMFYNWIITFTDDSSLALFKLKNIDIINSLN